MSIIRETKVEAKGVSKAKKFQLQVNEDNELIFNSGNKDDDLSILLDDSYTITLEPKKKFTVSNPSESVNIIISTATDEESSQWVELLNNQIKEARENKYFGVDLDQIDTGASGIPSLVLEAVNRISKSMEVSGIFRLSGSKNEIDGLKRAYNSKNKPVSLEEYDVHVITGLLKLFLRELPNPLCTFELYQEFLGNASGKSMETGLANTLKKLPPIYQSNLKFLLQFLKKVGDVSDENKMTYSNLAVVLGPNILRPQIAATDFTNDSHIVTSVVAYMIEHSNALFGANTLPKPPFAPPGLKKGLGIPPPLRQPTPEEGSPLPGFKLPTFTPPLKKVPPKLPNTPPNFPLPLKKAPPPVSSSPQPPQFSPIPQSNSAPTMPPKSSVKHSPISKSESMQLLSDHLKERQKTVEEDVEKKNLTRSPSASHLSKRSSLIVKKENKEEKKENKEEKKKEEPQDDGWKEYETEEGTKYYYNHITGITQWDKPASFSKPNRVKKHKKRSSNIEKTRSVTMSTTKTKKSKDDGMINDSYSKSNSLLLLSAPILKPPPVLETPPPLSPPVVETPDPIVTPTVRSTDVGVGDEKDSDKRIEYLERKVNELELVVKRQSELLERILGKIDI